MTEAQRRNAEYLGLDYLYERETERKQVSTLASVTKAVGAVFYYGLGVPLYAFGQVCYYGLIFTLLFGSDN